MNLCVEGTHIQSIETVFDPIKLFYNSVGMKVNSWKTNNHTHGSCSWQSKWILFDREVQLSNWCLVARHLGKSSDVVPVQTQGLENLGSQWCKSPSKQEGPSTRGVDDQGQEEMAVLAHAREQTYSSSTVFSYWMVPTHTDEGNLLYRLKCQFLLETPSQTHWEIMFTSCLGIP